MDYNNIFTKKRNDFLSSVENAATEQTKVLQNIINTNKNTKIGEKYNFSKITSVSDFQNSVKISVYEDYEEYIEEIKNGKQNVLTKDKVLILEPTGGSTSGSKYIPYTESLKQAFNKGLEPWLSDLFLSYPEILNNPMYWSITPSTKSNKTKSLVPIGFDNDMEYLNSPFSDIISKLIIIPDVKNCSTQEFYNRTETELKKNPNCAFVSVWNPTLYLNIIKGIETPSKIWKNCRVISCWDECNAKIYAQKLQKLFPDAIVQGKGLLATEGIVTIPIEGIGKLPCVQSHFFEFIDTNTQEIKLLHELEKDKTYSVLLTTQGGLYRYKIGDIVKVYGYYKSCPLLSFIGRENNICDYFGEKLHESFVNNILKETGLSELTKFILFAPFKEKEEFYYTLYLECETEIDLEKLNETIETELLKNFHYKYARELGQLGRFRIKKIQNGLEQYLNNCVEKGQKLGDIKPITFSKDKNWNFKTETEAN